MATPKPPEFDLWRPWYFWTDPDTGKTKRVLKELDTLPIVLELCQHTGFVSRAHSWAWAKQGPTPKGKTPTTWPPELPTARQAVGEYWHQLNQGYQRHAPHLLEPTPTTMQQAIDQAVTLSAANPFLVW